MEKFVCIMMIFYLKKNDVFKIFIVIVVVIMQYEKSFDMI